MSPSPSKVIADGAIVPNTWQQIGDDESLPAPESKVIVSLTRFREDGELAGWSGPLGVAVPNDVDAETLEDVAARADLIALEFPKFADGRAYSQARILRDQLGYDGTLRATGDVLRDQLFYMARVGFDEFAVRPDKSIEDALEALDTFSVTYQPAADEARPHFRR